MGIAEDKRSSPGKIEFSSSSLLAEVGKMATNAIQNLVGVFMLAWNDSICGKKKVPIIYTRTSPVGDVDLGALPIGSWCLQYDITSTAITGFALWFKTAEGIYGWEKSGSSVAAKALDVKTAITTAGAVTYSAAQMVNGFIIRDPNGAGRTDPTATAAALLEQARAVFGNISVGSNFIFEIANTADANEVITLGAGAGVTLWPASQTIAQNANGRFRAVFTNVTAGAVAVTIYKV